MDFTAPYLESGIAIVVAKRTGIISPTAFLGEHYACFNPFTFVHLTLILLESACETDFLSEWKVFFTYLFKGIMPVLNSLHLYK